jgi:haloalkane dehalogenase
MADLLAAPPLPAWLEKQMPFSRHALLLPSGKKMCFVDEGRGQPVLMVHGNPTWSYLYRKMIPLLTARGFRSIAPDLIGFGSSDKHRRPGDHSLSQHGDDVRALVEALELEDVVIVGQDWGGPIVSAAAMQLGDRIGAAVLGNTAVLTPARPLRSKPFHRFSHLPLISDLAFIGLGFPVPVMSTVQGDRSSIGPLELAAYFHPFWKPWDRAGPLGLARMVPNAEDHPSTAVMDRIGRYWSAFDKPIALVWGKRDPILGRSLKRHREAFPRALVTETEAGHFLQEEVPNELVDAVVFVAGQTKKSSISSAPGVTAY